MKENLSICPVCEHELSITKYKCNKCKTEINGNFKQDNFSKLTKEQKDFVEIFVLKRGSIKEIEKELGISYPTVRNKLDNVISALGHKVESDTSKIEILNMLNNGEITSEEATKMLSEL
ncbi:DUF2089 family protein [Helcococcus kunzii]|uniref:DUF2089 domain-containing protein n=1 Tax=Helcococcus kunzii TaxID=40091 RepID=UPI0038A4F6D4